MDKAYSEYVTYAGEGANNYVYCTPVDPAASSNIIAGNIQPLETIPQAPVATAVEVSLMQQKYEVQPKYGVPHRYQYVIPVELQNVKLEKDQLTCLQPIVICQETQTIGQRACQDTQAQNLQTLQEAKGNSVIIQEQYYVEERQENVSYTVRQDDKNTTQSKLAECTIPPEIKIEAKKKARQKIADPKSWSSNVRKTKHQRGEAYISRRGKYVPEKKIRNMKDCRVSCKLQCGQQLSETDRQHIFKAFYSLSSNEKKHFILNTTERHCVKRPSKLGSDEPKRKYTFKYFFLVRATRYTVCKAFYLGTLAISQKPIYNVHMHKSDMNLPKPDGRGLTPTSCHAISEERKDRVRRHISSFHAVDLSGSSNSNRRMYLDKGLSIKKMHKMYVDMCNSEGVEPLKESMYRKIFNLEFNLHFKKEKKVERCDSCKQPIKRKISS